MAAIKQQDADMIAEAIIKKAQGGVYNESAKMASAPKRNPIVQVEKIENGFLVKDNDYQLGGGYKSMYAKDLSEIPALLEKMWK